MTAADEVAALRKRLDAVAETAADNRSSVASIRNQTGQQWDQLREVQGISVRQTTMMERVVEDQRKLAGEIKDIARDISGLRSTHALAQRHDDTIKDLEAGVADYRANIRALKVVKWFASIGGGAGVLALAKTWLGFPGQGS